MVVRRLDGKGSETQPVGSRSLRGYAQHLRPAGHEIPAIVHQAARLSRISLRSIRATCCAARSPFRASRGRMKALLATTPLLIVGLCIGDQALTTVSVCVTCMVTLLTEGAFPEGRPGRRSEARCPRADLHSALGRLRGPARPAL